MLIEQNSACGNAHLIERSFAHFPNSTRLVALGSRIAAAFNCFDSFLERGVIHGHEVMGIRKPPAPHVLGVFLERSDTLVLESLVFLEKIPVGSGMAGNAFGVVSEDVVGKEELRVATAAGAQRHEERRVCDDRKRARLCGTTSSSAA